VVAARRAGLVEVAGPLEAVGLAHQV